MFTKDYVFWCPEENHEIDCTQFVSTHGSNTLQETKLGFVGTDASSAFNLLAALPAEVLLSQVGTVT